MIFVLFISELKSNLKMKLEKTNSNLKQEGDETKTVENTTLSNMDPISDQIENIPQSQRGQQEKQEKQTTKPHSYRPDIDGLRTIAILTVLIYHAFPTFMPGGFIGVDIFFVISGYLISQILIKQTLQNRFSYINFYSRRVKRIYPALLLVLGYVLYVVVSNYRYDELGFTLKTLTASTVFGANFQVLAHQKTYFDPQIHVNPLLHLWSLGVEEQFYIFWPCLISIGLNVFKKRTFLVLTIYTVFSFVFGIVCVFINSKFAFYFPLSRFWQMAVGGLVAYLSVKIQNTKITNALSIVGTCAILITIWIIDQKSLFPGFWALVPTLASAGIIQAGPESLINKHILSTKVFVFIGKISYPMYLWHWPLLVFSRYFYPEGSTSIYSNVYLVLLMTILLSILTYYFVENPIRKIKTKKIAIPLLILILMIGAFSYWNLIQARQKQELEWKSMDKDTLFIKAQRQMLPRRQDYIQKNGRLIPNLSKSRNRRRPTVVSTQVARDDYLIDWNTKTEMVLDRHVTPESKYFVKNHPLHGFFVENEGRENQLFIMGDSHSLRISYHFQQLFRDSVREGREGVFPTVVDMSKMGFPYIGGNKAPLFPFVAQQIRTHRPKRLLLAFHWLLSYCNDHRTPNPKCRYSQFSNDFILIQQFIRQAQQLGVQVFSTAIALDHPNFSPERMIDKNGIIEENLKPINYTEYREKHKVFIEMYEGGMREMGVEVIDLADNLCYEGMCEVTSPLGYSVYYDQHHHGKFYSRHWLSVLDHLVQF